MTNKLFPTGPISDYQHPKCYARQDRNCSAKISKEHFISKNLLEQMELNNTAKIAGLRWQQKEQFDIVPIPVLASNILCERHNNVLSPLDACMGQFAEAVRDYDAGTRLKDAPSELRSFSGDDIERWMLKCVVGLFFSKNITATVLKPECVDLLFATSDWPEGWGLYFNVVNSEEIYHSSSILIETKTDLSRQLILAAKVVIRGLPFMLSLGKPGRPQQFGFRRPSAIVLRSGKCEKTLGFSWTGGSDVGPIYLDRTGSYDGPPPDWQSWEKTL